MGRPSYKIVAAGIDTIEVNASGPLADHMPSLLDAFQKLAVTERDEQPERKRRQSIRVPSLWELCGQPLLVAPHGVGSGMQFKWLVSTPDVLFRVAEKNLNDITVKTRLGSSFLWEHGHWQAWEYVEALLAEWGTFTFQPSEVHLCVDIAGMEMRRLSQADFTRRAHAVRWHQEDAQILSLPKAEGEVDRSTVSVRYGEQEGISFSPGGGHSVVLYNKPREIRYHSPDKAWFGDIWKRNGWNGIDPITRCEIRYKRDILHEMGIETMADLAAGMDGMWGYSTQQWMRHTIPSQDKQRSRWPTSPWWQVVQGATFEREDAAPLQREHVSAFHERRTLATILGHLETWAAWKAGDAVSPSLDISTVLREVALRSDGHYEAKDSDFLASVLKKRHKIGYAS